MKNIQISLIAYTGIVPNRKAMNVRYCEASLDKTREHKYLNLYDSPESSRWSSCIECDDITFDKEENLLIYRRGDVNMYYLIENDEDFMSIVALFE